MLCFVICNQKDDKAESDNKNTTPPHVLLYFSRHTGCRHKKYLHVLLVFEGGGVVQTRTAKRLGFVFFELLGSKGVLII